MGQRIQRVYLKMEKKISRRSIVRAIAQDNTIVHDRVTG